MTQTEKEAVKAAKQTEKEAVKGELQIEVGDPQLLRPVELPLVVKPADGQDWTNEAQAEFARTLNAYAYKNPTKWETKKAKLIEQLKEVGRNPSKLQFLKGGDDGKLSFKNKIIES